MTYKIKISYDGKNYHGYQKQKNKLTVEQCLIKAFKDCFKKDIKPIASGRTDAGVSALNQVVSFEIDEEINCYRTINRLNSLLPNDIRVCEIEKTTSDFNARYSSKQKTYVYLFYMSKINNPIYDKFATRVYYDLNIKMLEENLNQVVGTLDYTSVTANDCAYENKVRTITSAKLKSFGDVYEIEITGLGFLKNMVRIIVGTLFDISRGKINLTMKEVLEKKDRNFAGKTAEAIGLILKEVEYNL